MNKYCLLAVMLFLEFSLHGQSLTGVNVDNLSDAQILSIFEEGQAQGYTIENGQEIALSMGLSLDDAKKFKSRLEILNSLTEGKPTLNAYSSSDEIEKKEALEKYGSEGSGKNLPFSSLSDDLKKKEEDAKVITASSKLKEVKKVNFLSRFFKSVNYLIWGDV